MTGHLQRTLIATWTVLPLSCAKHRHAELAIYQDLILQRNMPQSTHLPQQVNNHLQSVIICCIIFGLCNVKR